MIPALKHAKLKSKIIIIRKRNHQIKPPFTACILKSIQADA